MIKNRVLVTGGTGAQGGAVARSLLAEGTPVRVLTRSPGGPAAARLRAAGAEIFHGDLADLPCLLRALDGCDGLFAVTNFWEHFGAEVTQGKLLVDAALASNVAHVVMSTLPSSRTLSGGALVVPHLDTKAEVEAYARARGLPATFVHVAFYFENFLSYFPPQPVDGGLHFGFPQGDTPLASVGVSDVGPVVAALLREPPRGDVVGIVGDELRGDEYAAILTAALGEHVQYSHIPAAVYARLGFPGAEELAHMFDLTRRFVGSRARDLARTRELHPGAASFATWAMANRAQLALAAARAA